MVPGAVADPPQPSKDGLQSGATAVECRLVAASDVKGIEMAHKLHHFSSVRSGHSGRSTCVSKHVSFSTFDLISNGAFKRHQQKPEDNITPLLQMGKSILIVGHEASVYAMCQLLEGDDEFDEELPHNFGMGN